MSTQDQAAVIAANQAFYDAFRRRDMAAMSAIWAEGHAVACLHPGSEALHGRESVLGSFRSILESPGSPRVTASGEVVVLMGAAAFLTCVEHLPGGELVATNVFVRDGGAWKMVHHHASPTAHPRSRRPPSSALN